MKVLSLSASLTSMIIRSFLIDRPRPRESLALKFLWTNPGDLFNSHYFVFSVFGDIFFFFTRLTQQYEPNWRLCLFCVCAFPWYNIMNTDKNWINTCKRECKIRVCNQLAMLINNNSSITNKHIKIKKLK